MKNNFILMLIVITTISISILIAWYINKPQTIMLQGEVVAKSYKVSSKLAGRIDSLTVKKGSQVKKGDFIFSLQVPEIKAKLEQAEAILNAASAKNMMAITGARPEEIETALSMWSKSKAGLRYAEETYARVNILFNEGVVPAQKFDEVSASLKASRATELAAKAQYTMAMAGTRKENKIATQALVAQARAGVKEVQAYLKDAIQYAPINGEVSSVVSEKNELVSSGFPVVMLLDTDDMWFSFNIKETSLPKFTIGKEVMIYIPAIDKHVPAKVSYIASQANYATWAATRASGEFDIKTFNVEFRPTQKIENLRPGMTGLIK